MAYLRGEEAVVAVVLVKTGMALALRSLNEAYPYQTWTSLGLASCLALQAFAVILFKHYGRESSHLALFRSRVYHGIYCVFLVPLAVLTISRTDDHTAGSIAVQDGLFLVAVGSAMLLLAPWMLNVTCSYIFFVLLALSLAVSVRSAVQEGMDTMPLLVGILTAVSTAACFPKLSPKSFTVGELYVVSHLLAHFVWRISTWLYMQLFYMQDLPNLEDNYVFIFMSVILVFVTLASVTVLLMKPGLHILLFLLVYAVFAVAALITLQIITHFNPVLWFLYFIWNTTRIQLLVWWFALAILTAVSVTVFTQTTSSSSSSSSSGNSRRSSSVLRKAFHFVVVAVYVPGLATDPVFLLLASIVALAVLIVLEVARLSKVQNLGPAVEKSFQMFVDDKDEGPVLLTHIYLLVGLSLPLWLAHSLHAGDLKNYAGVISLGIGDTFACLFGIQYGRTRWPGTDKNMEGTAASIVLQLVFIVLIALFDWAVVSSWWNVVFAVLVSSVYEALATQIDNLVLPLVMMAARL